MGSDLKLIFLLSKDRTSDEDFKVYEELDVAGLGLDKDLVVIKKDNGHIHSLNEKLISKVS